MYPEELYGVRVMRVGAKGYVHKASSPDHLLEAVATVLAGQRYVSPKLVECLARAVQPSFLPSLHESLTDREFEVLLRLVQGWPMEEIASELFVCPNTISAHRKRLMKKLGLKYNSELCRYALDHSLAERLPL
jgi:two-component system invasion response regulator UvrY